VATLYQVLVRAEDVPAALDLLAELVARPRLAGLRAERGVVLEEMAGAASDPADRADTLLDEAIWGPAHPYARPILGRPRSLARMDRATLLAFHRRTHVGRRIVLAACGAIDAGALVSAVSRGPLARLPAGRARRLGPLPGARPAPGPRTARMEVEQCHVVAGARGPGLGDAALPAVQRLSMLLGAMEGSRLQRELRSRLGIAYDVGTAVTAYERGGRVSLWATTRPERLGTCLEVVARELAALRAGGVDADDWATAERAHLVRMALDHDSHAAWCDRLAYRAVLGLPPQGYAEAAAEAAGVRRRDVTRWARALWAPGAVRLVGIGPAPERFLAAAARAGL
jgi:zinc protease